MSFTILIVDDDLSVCRSLKEVLEEDGFKAIYSLSPLNIASTIAKERIDLMLLDIRMPEIGGIDVLKLAKTENYDVPVIIISGHATVDIAVSAMKLGASNLFTKPIDLPRLLSEVRSICMSKKSNELALNKPRIVTRNRRMQEIMNRVEKAAPTDAAVLIVGESGTGKELIADAIHQKSRRGKNSFVKINCAAIPEALLESEFFGHEKGAFTDAKSMRRGKFELAAGGSVFLDEIGDMSYSTQAKLLRVLQEKSFTRVGGSEQIEADCRIVAATNKNLEELIAKGVFREDLYYRLSVVVFTVPPLRERRDEILPLAEYYLSRFCSTYGKQITGFSNELVSFMTQHSWPGNIRELRNFVEHAVIFTNEELLSELAIPEQYKSVCKDGSLPSLRDKEDEILKRLILEALHRSKGKKTVAADLLKIDRKTLYNRLKRLHIEG